MREPNQHPGRPADPCAMVIWGASGDLTKRKLIPALYNLANDHLLSSEFAIVGFARVPSGRLTPSTSGAWNLARY
jgi:glucose-6-phosphate 1-dehydrogenase